ncbi:MAG: DUF3782 domain-containing protein [Candidatus Competibacter sp.]|nr:DUF3782 domain-containing protein [Candidatus Competibacter sp.]
MSAELLKETIKRELPGLLRDDPSLRAYILELTRWEYAGRAETQDRFYDLLAELRRDREEQTRKWDEQNRKWDEQNRKWDELQAELRRDREEQTRKWNDQNLKWDEQNRKWDAVQAELRRDREERAREWDEYKAEQNRRWEANQVELRRLHEEIMAQAQKHERGIGALGSRWGLQSEKAFRDALAGILEKNFGVQVVNVNEYDDQGEVFGRPDQVELDVIIKNGLLLICELKSSIDKAGMYIFERKARFYEQRHQRTANRLIVISPMIDARARKVAERLGIETYGDSTEVEAL